MDGFYVKEAYIGFKCEPGLKKNLSDVASRKGLTLSKLICRVLLDYVRKEGVLV